MPGTADVVYGTEAQWAAVDPVLGDGQFAVSTDVRRFKYGNGTDAWTVLSYHPIVGGDMQSLTYDPTGVSDDAFNAGNLGGNLDGGTF